MQKCIVSVFLNLVNTVQVVFSHHAHKEIIHVLVSFFTALGSIEVKCACFQSTCKLVKPDYGLDCTLFYRLFKIHYPHLFDGKVFFYTVVSDIDKMIGLN